MNEHGMARPSASSFPQKRNTESAEKKAQRKMICRGEGKGPKMNPILERFSFKGGGEKRNAKRKGSSLGKKESEIKEGFSELYYNQDDDTNPFAIEGHLGEDGGKGDNRNAIERGGGGKKSV